jgi:alkylated DNA repair dioxygenase AlkB
MPDPLVNGSMTSGQLSLFEPSPALPAGFRYGASLISPEQERDLLERFAGLAFAAFEFQGHAGKRRVVSFGWAYDFNQGELRRADDVPPFLLPLREAAAGFAGLDPSGLQHALVTEYAPGAPIGWHKDKAVFGDVVGVSLLSPCVFRLRRKAGDAWERASLTLEPRSAYLLQGAARTGWEHSIPAVGSLRYSVTFRNLRSG